MSDVQKIDSMFCAALDLESAGERAVYHDRACGHDAELRGRVDRLLAAQAQAGNFMQDPDDPEATADRPITEQPGPNS